MPFSGTGIGGCSITRVGAAIPGGAFGCLASFSTIALGGWTGVGLGNGTAKWGFLPIVYSDFVFAAIAEELGFGGCLVVVACYAVFGILGFRAALHAPDRFGTLLAVGLTLTVLVLNVIARVFFRDKTTG